MNRSSHLSQESARSLPFSEKNPVVSIVIPAYNEELAIAGVIREVKSSMGNTSLSYEILVVDDYSQDTTFEKAKAEGVRVLRMQRRRGSGMARRNGIIAAIGEIIVMLDADGSYQPADIPRLLEHFPEYDQVNGARLSEQGTLRWLRAPAKFLIRKLASYLSHTHIPDLNTGLKAFKRSIMMRYLWVLPDGFSCVSTMTLAFLCNGHEVKWIPAGYRKRIGKSKFHPIWDTVSYLLTVIRMIMYFKPLSVFLPVSFLLLAVSVTKCVLSVWASEGGLGIFEILLAMTAILVAMIGLVADLIVAQGRKSTL
jgi:polyisoprenyl-phosphate glycosyltransferase